MYSPLENHEVRLRAACADCTAALVPVRRVSVGRQSTQADTV